MKRLVNIFVIFIIITSISCNVIAENKSIKQMSIDEAIEQALNNNRQIAIDDLNIKAKELAVKQARTNADMTGDTYGAERVLESRINKEVRITEAETALEIARRSKQDNIRQLKLDTYIAFQNILLKQKEIEIEQQRLAIVKERVVMTESKLKAKTITKEDLDAAQYDLYSKTLDIERLSKDLENLDMQLKDYLNLPFESDLLTLEGTISIEPIQNININKVVADNIDSSTDVYTAKGKYEAGKRVMELTAEVFKEGDEVYNNNKADYEIVLRGYETTKRNREVSIRNTYNDVLNKKANIDLASKFDSLMLKRFESATTRYNVGQINKETYLAAKDKCLEAELNKIKVICEFNKQKAKFDSMVGLN